MMVQEPISKIGVGSFAALNLFQDDKFKEEHDVTIGVDFGSFVIKSSDKLVKCQIWDTAGQETFRTITRIFYKGAHAVFLTYDVTRDDTFLDLEDWLMEVKQRASPDILIYLVGNQADNEEFRQVSTSRGADFAKRNKLDGFFETSAKTGSNVELVFSLAAKHLLSLHRRGVKSDTLQATEPVKLKPEPVEPRGRKACCG